MFRGTMSGRSCVLRLDADTWAVGVRRMCCIWSDWVRLPYTAIRTWVSRPGQVLVTYKSPRRGVGAVTFYTDESTEVHTALKTSVLAYMVGKQWAAGSGTCPICLETNGGGMTKPPCCRAVVHVGCATEWLRRCVLDGRRITCPHCATIVCA
jgi:hypothetical protein